MNGNEILGEKSVWGYMATEKRGDPLFERWNFAFSHTFHQFECKISKKKIAHFRIV